MYDEMIFDADDFLGKMAVIEAKVMREENELFGNSDGSDLSDEEFNTIFNFRLSHEEKLAKLKVIRSGKQVKAKSFGKRLTRAGRIHAQALGIKLD